MPQMYFGILFSSSAYDFQAIALSVHTIDLPDCQKVFAQTQSGENGQNTSDCVVFWILPVAILDSGRLSTNTGAIGYNTIYCKNQFKNPSMDMDVAPWCYDDALGWDWISQCGMQTSMMAHYSIIGPMVDNHCIETDGCLAQIALKNH